MCNFNENDLGKLGLLFFHVWRMFGFIKVSKKTSENENDKNKKIIIYESSNFTLINLYLVIMGPTRENKVTLHLLILQVILF